MRFLMPYWMVCFAVSTENARLRLKCYPVRNCACRPHFQRQRTRLPEVYIPKMEIVLSFCRSYSFRHDEMSCHGSWRQVPSFIPSIITHQASRMLVRLRILISYSVLDLRSGIRIRGVLFEP